MKSKDPKLLFAVKIRFFWCFSSPHVMRQIINLKLRKCIAIYIEDINNYVYVVVTKFSFIAFLPSYFKWKLYGIIIASWFYSSQQLHDVKHHFNYGTVGHTGRYDNGKLSGSGTREDLARVPAAVTVKSGQKQDYHQFHDLTKYQSYHQNLPDGNNSLLGGSALGEIQNYSKTNGATRKRTTDSKELYPSHSRKLDDSSLSVSNSSSKAKDFSQPLQHLIDSSQTKESNPVQNSQLPLSPPGPSSNSSSPIPQLSAPIFTRRQSQSPPVGSSLLASAQTHEQENEGHDNPAFSFASEQTECPPEQLSTEGDKHVSLIDVVVRL